MKYPDADIELEYIKEKTKQREYKKQLKLNTGAPPTVHENSLISPDAWHSSVKDTASVVFEV